MWLVVSIKAHPHEFEVPRWRQSRVLLSSEVLLTFKGFTEAVPLQIVVRLTHFQTCSWCINLLRKPHYIIMNFSGDAR